MLRHRLITGPLLVLMFLAIIVTDNALDTVRLSGFWQTVFQDRHDLPRGIPLFVFAILVAAPLAAWELSNIFAAQGIASNRLLTSTAAIAGVVLSYSIPMNTEVVKGIAIVSTGMILVFVASLLIFSQHRNVQGVVAAAGAVMFAMVYLGLMMGFLLALRRFYSAWWIVGIVLVTKACDSGAYFTGRAIGRHKLIPWLSPRKTWEGLVGGLVTSTLAGVLLAWLSSRFLADRDMVPLAFGAWWGLIFGVAGVFGDLIKSLLKRGAGIKDSSSILPGLGGVLDVLDSPLMVAPVAYWVVTTMVPR